MRFYVIICISFIFYVVLEGLVKLIGVNFRSFFVNDDTVFFLEILVYFYVVWFKEKLKIIGVLDNFWIIRCFFN